MAINESITHIEDLPLIDKVDKDGKILQKNFIDRISEIAKLRITQKLDGSFLRFGIDNDGKLYTTRDGKTLIYSVADWGDPNKETQGMTGFKATQLALKDQLAKIKSVMEPGTAMDMEILFGKQPNAITYGVEGYNYIAFLKAAVGTDATKKPNQNNVDELIKVLKNETSSVKVDVLDTDDGINIKKIPTTTEWKFTSADKIDGKKLEDVDIDKELHDLKKFLAQDNEAAAKAGITMTNLHVATANLTSIPKEKRNMIADEREVINANIMNNFKLSIKKKLLRNFNKRVKPQLSANLGGEDAEGVVLLDPDTDEQVKIVDKDVFTAINTFNQSVRRELKGAVRTTDPNASIESTGGLLGDVKLRVANLFNIEELARTASAKKVFSKFKGATPEETIRNFAKNLGDINDNAYRHKISAILGNALDELSKKLEEFKLKSSEYKLTLKNGKEVSYSPDIIKKTLIAFAETRRTIMHLKEKVDSSKSIAELINAMFGRTIEMMHDNQKVTEDLASVTDNYAQTGDSRTKVVKGMSAEDIIDAYLYTYCAALVLIRCKDRSVARLLRDGSHTNLKKYSSSMSQLNFWGHIAMEPDSSSQFLNSTAKRKLVKLSQRVLSSRLKEIHYPISSLTNLKLNWDQVDENLRVLFLRLERSGSVYQEIRTGLIGWDKLSESERANIMSKIFYGLLRTDPGSSLLTPMRSDINSVRVEKPVYESSLMKDILKLTEDGDGDAGAAGDADGDADDAPAVASTAGSIASVPFKLFKGKVIRRIPRRFGKQTKFARKRKSLLSLLNKTVDK